MRSRLCCYSGLTVSSCREPGPAAQHSSCSRPPLLRHFSQFGKSFLSSPQNGSPTYITCLSSQIKYDPYLFIYF